VRRAREDSETRESDADGMVAQFSIEESKVLGDKERQTTPLLAGIRCCHKIPRRYTHKHAPNYVRRSAVIRKKAGRGDEEEGIKTKLSDSEVSQTNETMIIRVSRHQESGLECHT